MSSLEEFKKRILSDEKVKEEYEALKIKQDIIKLFLHYRTENNLSQKDLAIQINTTQQAVSRLEKNLINPSIEFLAKSLRTLGYELVLKKINN
ncbi:helix-turn-helix domain-containing protein [Psychrilyobacter piezotolerans]|uniref:Helix-turn-helix domain-containing protein n=2 Tax=Fusobacteriaceae TaxID=203492 RepID=A0ABX9KE86_9FUSO|nr:helix-turn-helix transcriptional regulator [Psychrilyobacter piezotolerans]RDE59262.1 XRE family transcriptional regulator [Psychrilyobacter sp. S5]REI39822.1 helix-turn-helix domain-containing protein [Psychrilyobacter piezotolerans]